MKEKKGMEESEKLNCTDSELENKEREDDTGEIDELKKKFEQKSREAEEYLDLLQRTRAEFDNYKKRTAKEKEVLYNNSVIDIMTTVLPVIDNLEKALESCSAEDKTGIVDGVGMVLKQLRDILKAHGITEIEALGQRFNPELHEAVAHVQDDNCGENVVVEEMRKGYKAGDRIIRHSMVKVAN